MILYPVFIYNWSFLSLIQHMISIELEMRPDECGSPRVVLLPLSSSVCDLRFLYVELLSHTTLSPFTGQLGVLDVCVLDYISALRPTSSPPVVWAAASSWASAPESEIRVRLQSVPLPPLLMLQARERAAGSPAAAQIQPARARTEAPGRQSATVCHFNPHTPTGLLGREGRGREATEWAKKKKRHPEAEGSLWGEQWSEPLKTTCCWLDVVDRSQRRNLWMVQMEIAQIKTGSRDIPEHTVQTPAVAQTTTNGLWLGVWTLLVSMWCEWPFNLFCLKCEFFLCFIKLHWYLILFIPWSFVNSTALQTFQCVHPSTIRFLKSVSTPSCSIKVTLDYLLCVVCLLKMWWEKLLEVVSNSLVTGDGL